MRRKRKGKADEALDAMLIVVKEVCEGMVSLSGLVATRFEQVDGMIALMEKKAAYSDAVLEGQIDSLAQAVDDALQAIGLGGLEWEPSEGSGPIPDVCVPCCTPSEEGCGLCEEWANVSPPCRISSEEREGSADYNNLGSNSMNLGSNSMTVKTGLDGVLEVPCDIMEGTQGESVMLKIGPDWSIELPEHMLMRLGWVEDDEVRMEVDGWGILVTKVEREE